MAAESEIFSRVREFRVIPVVVVDRIEAALPLADADDILGFNTPDQLLAVEATVTARERKAEVSARSQRPRIDPAACRPVAIPSPPASTPTICTGSSRKG